MKWTDEHIDSLFQKAAGEQSFAYKSEYWDDFSSALSDHAPLSEASDDEIDAAFQQSASNQSFEYNSDYWDAFAKELDANVPLSQAKDTQLDAAFQEDAAAISVAYKPEFWNEFNDSLSSMPATENVTDDAVDALYQNEAANLSFAYKPAYWEEMAALLRRRRRRPEFLWFGMSGIFTSFLVVMLMVEQSPLNANLLAPSLLVEHLQENANSVSPYYTTSSTYTAQASFNKNQKLNDSNTIDAGIMAISNNAETHSNQIQTAVQTPSSSLNQVSEGGIRNLRLMEKMTPSLLITTSLAENEATVRALSSSNAEIGFENLATRDLDKLASSTPGGLVPSEITHMKKYKGGTVSQFYVQGLSGVSQSVLANSNDAVTTYGIGLGWLMHKRRWTVSIGSNITVENYSNLHLSGSAFRHIGFSGGLVRNDYEFNQLINAELDFSLGYNYGRHQFRFGVRPSFAVNSFVTENQILSMYSEDGTVEETLSTSQGFNTTLTGIQRFGIKPSIGYTYNFISGWSVGATVGAELMPTIYEDFDFVIGSNRSLPIDGQLYLRKTLNFRK